MAMKFERRSSPAAEWSARVASFALVLLLTAGASHRYALLETFPFFWVLGIVFTLAVLALILAAIGFINFWERNTRGARMATKGVLIALIVIAPFAFATLRLFTYPRLVDISTDLTDPPELRAAQRLRTPEMNGIDPITDDRAARQQAFYEEIVGRRYDLPSDRVLEVVTAMVRDRGWLFLRTPPAVPAGEVTLEAVAHTLVFRFPSDVAIRIAGEGGVTTVDMRSASRYGVHDFGDNAARIDGFLDALDAVLGASPVQ